MYSLFFFFFNDTATTEIYTLSLHDALPSSLPSWTSTSTTSGSNFCARRRASAPDEARPTTSSPCADRKREAEARNASLSSTIRQRKTTPRSVAHGAPPTQ